MSRAVRPHGVVIPTSERVYTPLSVSRIGCPRGLIRAEPGPAVSQGTPLSTQKLLSSAVLLAPGGEQCLGWLTPLVTRGPHAFHGRAQHPRMGGESPPAGQDETVFPGRRGFRPRAGFCAELP